MKTAILFLAMCAPAFGQWNNWRYDPPPSYRPMYYGCYEPRPYYPRYRTYSFQGYSSSYDYFTWRGYEYQW